jgi:cell division transport system permease protein
VRIALNNRWLAWRNLHFHSSLAGLQRLIARPWATAFTVLVLGFALALPLLFFLVYDNARTLSGNLREAREITVFLKPTLNARAANALASEVRARSDVAAVVVRTPEQGLAEFRQLSDFGAALDALQDNPLPSVLVITPRGNDMADNPPLVGTLKADTTRVDLVQYDAAWRHKLSDILHFSERLVIVIAALLALVTTLVIGNTVRMDIQTRSEEIAVMQLVGASNGFVRRPFLYIGAWYGVFGSLLSLLLIAIVELALAEPIRQLLDVYAHSFSLHGIGVMNVLATIGMGAVLGWLGAWVATARHLRAGRPQR